MAYGIFFGTVLHVKSDKLCSKVCFPPISVTTRACLNVWLRALAGLRWMTVMGAERIPRATRALRLQLRYGRFPQVAMNSDEDPIHGFVGSPLYPGGSTS